MGLCYWLGGSYSDFCISFITIMPCVCLSKYYQEVLHCVSERLFFPYLFGVFGLIECGHRTNITQND